MKRKITAMPFSDSAVEYFLEGYNCAQAVYAAFAPALGISAEEALRLSSPFGGGFGRMREVCGAFSGMMLVVGHIFGYDTIGSAEQGELYPRVQQLGERFRQRFGTLICRELLKGKAQVGGIASDRTPEYYKDRPCARFVEGAAEILEEYLKEEGVLA